MSPVAYLTVLLLASLVSLHATRNTQATAESPFVGTWTMNLSKSKLDPKYAVKSATIKISVARDTVTLATESVDASGKARTGTETFRTDGAQTQGTLTPGVVHHASWVGPEVLALTAKKDGHVFAIQTFEVSADGKTLTSRMSGISDQVVVFDRR